MIYLWPFLIISYFLGSIPFGLILSKGAGYGDIRKIGSGNIGATNVLRTGNKFLALLTLILDGGKGAFAIFLYIALIASLESERETTIISNADMLQVGFAAILGHMFPVWLKFKGGKGVATALGVFLTATPYAGLTACVTWLVTAFLFRYSSLSALMAFLAAPIVMFVIYTPEPAYIGFIISALVWFRHRANIRRLLKGEEPKIGRKK